MAICCYQLEPASASGPTSTPVWSMCTSPVWEQAQCRGQHHSVQTCVWNWYSLYRSRSFSLRRRSCVPESSTHLQLTLLPGSLKRSPFLRIVLLYHPKAAVRVRPPSPPPNFSMTDYLGANSRSPVLGPFHSPMLSLGTKCKSVAVPASIKNFKNRTKQTEKDFHNNLKIH